MKFHIILTLLNNQYFNHYNLNDVYSQVFKIIITNYQLLKGPINIGMPEEIKVIDVARLIIKMTESKSQIVFKKLPSDDPKRRLPDISLAKKELNWEPTVSLEVGLTKTIDYIKSKVFISREGVR